MVIETGLVFEQETLDGVQNLAIAAGSVVGVDTDEAGPSGGTAGLVPEPGARPARRGSRFGRRHCSCR